MASFTQAPAVSRSSSLRSSVLLDEAYPPFTIQRFDSGYHTLHLGEVYDTRTKGIFLPNQRYIFALEKLFTHLEDDLARARILDPWTLSEP